MKTKVMLSACALAACFVGCTNEDFLTEQTIGDVVAGDNGIVGADLVSQGMKISLVGEGADTRATDGKWENGDQFGLAWYRFGSAQITSTQDEAAWNSTAGWTTDNKIYANHIFTYNNGSWGTVADVYQGAYFLYMPYGRLGEIKAKTINVNGEPQKADFDEERFNKALHLSAQDFISKDEAVDENNELKKEFYISPMVNVMRVTTTPETSIGNSAYLQGLNITGMRVYASADDDEDVFVTSGELVPRYIPKVVRNKEGGIDYNATQTDMDNAAQEATGSSQTILSNTGRVTSNYVETVVENPDYTLAASRDVRAFAWPIRSGINYTTDENPYFYVYVGRLDENNKEAYKLGCFGVYADQQNNSGTIAKLRNSLDATKAAENTSLTKFLRNGGKWTALGLPVTMNLANLDVYTSDIRSIDQWKDLVNLYNALFDVMGEEEATALLGKKIWVLTDKVVFENGINTPDDIEIAVQTSGDGVMVIAGDVTWPENLNAAGFLNPLVVNEGATLTFDPSEAKTLNAVIKNHGTIKAGEWASISNEQPSNYLDNSNGRVIVEYGAYVYPEAGKEGVIAYEISDSNPTTIRNINTLITPEDPSGKLKGYAQVNTLIINNTTLDLNALAAVGQNGDRYETGTQSTVLKSLDEVAIELNNGAVERVLGGSNNAVAGVTAVSGTNTITDIKTPTIKVNEAVLNVESETVPKTPLTGIETITNYGRITFNVDGEVDKVYNYKHISVTSPYKVTYRSIEQTNPEGDQGNFSGNLVPAYSPDPSALAATQRGVESAWTTLKQNESYKDVDSLDELASTIRSFASDKAPQTEAFIAALNEWLNAYYGDTSHNVTKESVSVEVLTLFQNVASFKFFPEP